MYITYVPTTGADAVTKKLGSIKKTLIGSGRPNTINCTGYPGWQTFNKDNFYVQPLTVNVYSRGDTNHSKSVNFGLSYNNSNGTLSINGHTCTASASNPDCGSWITYEVYLLTV